MTLHQSAGTCARLGRHGLRSETLCVLLSSIDACRDHGLALLYRYSTLIELDDGRLVSLVLVRLDVGYAGRLGLRWGQRRVGLFVELIWSNLAHGRVPSCLGPRSSLLIRHEGRVDLVGRTAAR